MPPTTRTRRGTRASASGDTTNGSSTRRRARRQRVAPQSDAEDSGSSSDDDGTAATTSEAAAPPTPATSSTQSTSTTTTTTSRITSSSSARQVAPLPLRPRLSSVDSSDGEFSPHPDKLSALDPERVLASGMVVTDDARDLFQRYVTGQATTRSAFRANLEGEEQPRQLIAMVIMLAVIGYFTLWNSGAGADADTSTSAAAKAALLSVSVCFLVYCSLQTRDGLLVRPHPLVFRVLHGVGVLYTLAAFAVVSLNVAQAKAALQVFIPEVGTRPMGVVAHDGDATQCSITPTTVFRQLTSVWFTAHVIGWWAKMCVFRDVGMCFVIASLFEILEVSLQHLIPEFAECWWDSVFMDSLGANALGIFLGYLTLRYLDSRHYQWIAYRPKGVTSRIKRVMWLFTPFSWSNYRWKVFESSRRFFWCAGVVVGSLVVELCSFLFIHVLQTPEKCWFLKARLVIYGLVGVQAVAEIHVFLNQVNGRLGHNAWLIMAMLAADCMIVFKFGRDRSDMQWLPPLEVVVCWGLFFVLFGLWTTAQFVCRSPKQRGLYRTPLMNALLFASIGSLLPLFAKWNWNMSA